jgi:hypothetical protein
MEERFKPSIQEETKTEIMRSLPRKEALDEKERGTFLLIKMLRIFDNCKARPTSRLRTRRRKLRQQQKHTNQILGLILGEKNNRKLTLRHKRRKEYQPSFVISVAKNSVRRKVRDPTMIWLHIVRRREPVSSETSKVRGGKLTATLGRTLTGTQTLLLG